MRSSSPHLSFALLVALTGCGGAPLAVGPSAPVASASASAAASPSAPEPARPAAPDKAPVVETPESVIAALRAYQPDLPETETATRDAVRAATRLNLTAAREPLLQVFLAMRASGLKRERELYRDVIEAMVKLADPAWEGRLVERLERPILDRGDVARLKDEVVWQTGAAQVLGTLRASNAVRPLLRVVLSPAKIDIAATAVNALIKIGKPAIGPATALLRSEDAELVGYSKSESLRAMENKPAPADGPGRPEAESAHVGLAAIVLAAIGREESVPALLDVMGRTDAISRAIIAREIPKLPRTPAMVKAFQSAFEKTPLTLMLPTGQGARESMIDAAAGFFDPSIVPWIVKSALAMKGEASDIDPLRGVMLVTALKLMKADQAAEVNRLVAARAEGDDGHPSTVGKALAREHGLVKAVVETCKVDVGCWFGVLQEPASQAPATQFNGIKAAYMIGSLGGVEARPRLLGALSKIDNLAIRFVIAWALDQLSPRGDAALADALQGMVDAGEASKDASRMAGNAILKPVIYRLRARAQ
jgi:hypothetical protein